MGKVLERCKVVLATKRCSDNESIGKLIRVVAKDMGVTITDAWLDHAIMHLKYGCAIW